MKRNIFHSFTLAFLILIFAYPLCAQKKSALELFNQAQELQQQSRWFDAVDLYQEALLLLDEHTAALDPKTAAKVLQATNNIVNKDHLTTLMITHNMRDAIANGNRLIMLNNGKVILDIEGEEKKKLTVDDLLHQFAQVSGEDFANDRTLLS